MAGLSTTPLGGRFFFARGQPFGLPEMSSFQVVRSVPRLGPFPWDGFSSEQAVTHVAFFLWGSGRRIKTQFESAAQPRKCRRLRSYEGLDSCLRTVLMGHVSGGGCSFFLFSKLCQSNHWHSNLPSVLEGLDCLSRKRQNSSGLSFLVSPCNIGSCQGTHSGCEFAQATLTSEFGLIPTTEVVIHRK